ncbi:MAG TPA: DUF1343 domain-containing protein [Isosphaeraceae bacterium]|nr:DUF1343 domain-containing protein [Isosphaeraceae bacterium]
MTPPLSVNRPERLRTSAGVHTGLDVLVAEGFQRLRGRRLGAIANPTSVDRRMRHLADLLQQAPGVTLVALFGPEHGVRGYTQDMVGVASEATDPRTGVPVFSLYGSDPASLSPTADQLSGIDTLVFDIQDVGSRYYTFATTMLYAMQAAAQAGVRLMVLDRPNPLGGEVVEGPSLQPAFASFVGPHPIPIRHGLTVAELAALYRCALRLDLDLEVVACQGLRPSMLWADTNLPWVMPSPNMPTPETALLYPGGCLVEGTNLSEGRGTTRPFALWGAPWLDPYRLADRIGEAPGVILRPCGFRPTFHKHAGQLCYGIEPIIVEPHAVRSLALYTRFLAAAREQDPDRFSWRTEPYEFVSDRLAIDLLFGSDRERQAIESGHPDDLDACFEAWTAHEAAFRDVRQEFLMYEWCVNI